MNTTPQDLPRYLKQNFSNIFVITGDEILLVEESAQAIKNKAKELGYEERHVIESDETDAMDHFLSHMQNLSFFSLKKIIEIRFRQKVLAAWSKLFVEMAANPDPNHIIIIRTSKLSKAETQEKWYKAIDLVGCIVTIWPLKQDALLRWIHSRLETLNIKVQRESIAKIAANTEGNLLATAQIIEKLHLAYGSPATVSHDDVCQMLSDQTHYTVYDLCDSVLGQNPSQALKILSTLKHQDTEPPIILWALLQEVRHLAALTAVPVNARGAVYTKRGIWSTRQPLFQKALTQISAASLTLFFELARQIDEIIKGLKPGNIWIELERFCLMLSGVKL